MTRMLDSFFRHRWMFLLSVIIVCTVTVAALKLLRPVYKAEAQTEVVSDMQQIVDALGDHVSFENVNSAPQNVGHFYDLMNDDRPGGFIDTALQNAHLDQPISIDPRTNDPRYALLRKKLVISSDSDTLFTITLSWGDQAECERIVTAFQQQFIEVVGQERQAKAVATMHFLEQEIKGYEAGMEKAEVSLINYKQSHSGELPEAQDADIHQFAQLKTQHDTLTITAQNSTLKRQALQQRLSQVPDMNVLRQTITDGPNVLALHELQSKRAELLASGYLPTSDAVKMNDHLLDMMRQQVQEDAKTSKLQGKVVTRTDMQNNPEYMALETQLTEALIDERTQLAELALVDKQIAAYESRIDKIPAAQRELNDKTRNYDVLKARFDKLAENYEEAQEKAQLDKVTASSMLIPVGTVYAEEATPKSKKRLMYIASVFFGLFVGVLIVILSEWSDPTLRYGIDAERVLGLPLLGEITDLPALSAPRNSIGPSR